MNYWLMKTEPDTYSWDDLWRDKKTFWDGVRNYQARIHLNAMKKGDQVLIYHSNEGKCIVGIAEIVGEARPDPKDSAWVVVELQAKEKLRYAVSLADIKATPKLSEMVLVKNSRLSVQPVRETEFSIVISMSMVR